MMLLAVATLDPTLRMLFYGIAVFLFAAAALGATWGKVSLVAAGLACFSFPFWWDALAAT